jgi:hypothetical protein
MKIGRADKFRRSPTSGQKGLLSRTFGWFRFVWKAGLSARKGGFGTETTFPHVSGLLADPKGAIRTLPFSERCVPFPSSKPFGTRWSRCFLKTGRSAFFQSRMSVLLLAEGHSLAVPFQGGFPVFQKRVVPAGTLRVAHSKGPAFGSKTADP